MKTFLACSPYKSIKPMLLSLGPRCVGLESDLRYRVFYQKRLDRIRNAEMAKRNRERAKNPTVFPSVPTGGLG